MNSIRIIFFCYIYKMNTEEVLEELYKKNREDILLFNEHFRVINVLAKIYIERFPEMTLENIKLEYPGLFDLKILFEDIEKLKNL